MTATETKPDETIDSATMATYGVEARAVLYFKGQIKALKDEIAQRKAIMEEARKRDASDQNLRFDAEFIVIRQAQIRGYEDAVKGATARADAERVKAERAKTVAAAKTAAVAE